MLISSSCYLLTGQFVNSSWHCTMAWAWQKLLCQGGMNGKQMVTLHAWNVTLCLQSAGKNHQTKTRARSAHLLLSTYILLLRNWFHFPFFTKINTCTIYLFLIFLKYKMQEIVARKACIYFVATVWWGNLHCISDLVVANKWWKRLVTLSVIKKCLLKGEDKYLCKMLLELAV